MSDWIVGFLNDDARVEVEALSESLRASFLRIVHLIEAAGLERMREPYVKHLEGKLWEMRLKGRDGIARSVYVTAAGKRVVVLRTFIKKTQKTPPRELKLAKARAKEVE
jgi:phage-related protein